MFANRFEEVKGVIELVKAIKSFNTHKNLEFLIAGSGSLDDFVKKTLMNLKNVHFMGWQSSKTIHELYLASDIYIMPSKFEALPLTLMEAMNAGLHIVYTAVGGIADIIKDYNAKTLLQDVSVSEIKKVIQILSARSYVGADNNSLSYAQSFDWENITNDTLKVYEKFQT